LLTFCSSSSLLCRFKDGYFHLGSADSVIGDLPGTLGPLRFIVDQPGRQLLTGRPHCNAASLVNFLTDDDGCGMPAGLLLTGVG
jgi:hypothetical protein